MHRNALLLRLPSTAVIDVQDASLQSTFHVKSSLL
jgi:hypothetical protein